MDFRVLGPLEVGGDIAPAAVPIFRVTGRTPPGEEVFDLFDGAVVDHVFDVPARLSG